MLNNTFKTFKTAIFKLHNPSKHKREVLDYVFTENTSLIANAFDHFGDKIPTMSEVTSYIPTGLPVHSCIREGIINHVHSQFQAYKALKGNGGNPPIALARSEEASLSYEKLVQQIFEADTDKELHEINNELRRVSNFKYQPLCFCGYANMPSGWMNRRFAILKNSKDKYYALLYLLPAKSENPPVVNITDMIDIKFGEVISNKIAKGAILVPLSFSEKFHKQRFMDVASIQSATLSKDNNDYYLHVAFEFPQGGKVAENYIGIDVGMITPIAISVIDKKGKVLFTKAFDSNVYKLQAWNRKKIADLQAQGKQIYLKAYKTQSLNAMFHDLINQIIEIAIEYNAAFVVENLDPKFITKGKFVTSCYRKIIKYLEYKTAVAQTPFAQFPMLDKKTGEHKVDKQGSLKWLRYTVLSVAAGGTSKICHECGEEGIRGKGDKRNYFQCPHCNWSGDADINAAANIARRVLYRKADWTNMREFHRNFAGQSASTGSARQLMLF